MQTQPPGAQPQRAFAAGRSSGIVASGTKSDVARFEQDRKAILAKVSHGNEVVRVVEDTGEIIRLQQMRG